MRVSRALMWLCDRPQGDFTLSWLLRRGWPEVADFVLLPKVFELGRLARLLERVIFWGAVGVLVFYRDLPLGSFGKPDGLTDWLVLLAVVKVIAVLIGLVVQLSLKLVAYVIGGFEKLAP